MQKKTDKSRGPITVKKYSNRRLYDTDWSRYITLDELAERIRGGVDVKVVDAKSGEDLTQPTLTQMIMESRGAAKLLPSSLLTQLIRMEDEALAEFLGRYLAGALELYQAARRGAGRVAPFYPFAEVPFAATNAFARLFTGALDWTGRIVGRERAGARDPGGNRSTDGTSAAGDEGPAPRDVRPIAQDHAGELAALRSELEELKERIRSWD